MSGKAEFSRAAAGTEARMTTWAWLFLATTLVLAYAAVFYRFWGRHWRVIAAYEMRGRARREAEVNEAERQLGRSVYATRWQRPAWWLSEPVMGPRITDPVGIDHGGD